MIRKETVHRKSDGFVDVSDYFVNEVERNENSSGSIHSIDVPSEIQRNMFRRIREENLESG